MRTELTLPRTLCNYLNVDDGNSYITLMKTSDGIILKQSTDKKENRGKVRFSKDRISGRATLPNVLLPKGTYMVVDNDGQGMLVQDTLPSLHDRENHIFVSHRT